MRQLRLYSVYSESPIPEKSPRPSHYYLAAEDMERAMEMVKRIKGTRVLTVREEAEVIVP